MEEIATHFVEDDHWWKRWVFHYRFFSEQSIITTPKRLFTRCYRKPYSYCTSPMQSFNFKSYWLNLCWTYQFPFCFSFYVLIVYKWLLIVIKWTKWLNSDVGNCIKVIFKSILIDSRTGQSEDYTCPRASWGLKQWANIWLIWVFILLVLILDGFFVQCSQMKAYNVLNPRKTAIQYLNLFFFYRQIGPNTGDISLNFGFREKNFKKQQSQKYK